MYEALRSSVTNYGASESIVLDNGSEFTSQVLQYFAQLHAIHLYYTTPCHPRGNSVVERMHRTLHLGQPAPRSSSEKVTTVTRLSEGETYVFRKVH